MKRAYIFSEVLMLCATRKCRQTEGKEEVCLYEWSVGTVNEWDKIIK